MKTGRPGRIGTFAAAPPGYRLSWHATDRCWKIRTPASDIHPDGVTYEAQERAKALDLAWRHFNKTKRREPAKAGERR